MSLPLSLVSTHQMNVLSSRPGRWNIFGFRVQAKVKGIDFVILVGETFEIHGMERGLIPVVPKVLYTRHITVPTILSTKMEPMTIAAIKIVPGITKAMGPQVL